jgi:hypothetical protein
VAAAAAAGVLLTATGTVGGLCFAAWALGDVLVQRAVGAPTPAMAWSKLAALPAHRRGVVERSYFGGLSHLQITRTLGIATA